MIMDSRARGRNGINQDKKVDAMKRLYLEDLKELDENGIKEHLVREYSGDESGFDQGEPSSADKAALAKSLEDYNVVIAYESVGSWGCDSSSWFLLQHKETGEYSEIEGSHCSCYGFEGQYDPQAATLEYLKSDKFSFYCGGYDDNETENQKAVKDFLNAL